MAQSDQSIFRPDPLAGQVVFDAAESLQKGRMWHIARPEGILAYDGFALGPDFRAHRSKSCRS